VSKSGPSRLPRYSDDAADNNANNATDERAHGTSSEGQDQGNPSAPATPISTPAVNTNYTYKLKGLKDLNVFNSTRSQYLL
jgi:hypothetical protein